MQLSKLGFPTAPAAGLFDQIKVMRVTGADELLVHFAGHFEIDLILIDCVAPAPVAPSPHEGVAAVINSDSWKARQCCQNLIDSASAVYAWIPKPERDLGWLHNLKPRQKFPAFVFIAEGVTLNESLVDRGLCDVPRNRWQPTPIW